MEALTLQTLRRANHTRQAEWPGSENASLEFRALEFAGEAGETCNKVKKLARHLHNIKGNAGESESQLLKAIADEMADSLITLDLLALKLDIDLAAATLGKFNATSNKHNLNTFLGHGMENCGIKVLDKMGRVR